MSKWPMVPLGEVLQQHITPTPVYADQEYPNFGIYSFGRGLFAKPPISGATTSAKNLYRVKAGQFIYSRLFAFEGAYGVVGEEFDGCFISNEYPHFDCDPRRLSARYLAAYLRWPTAWERAATLSTGMGDRRRRIQPEQLMKMEIPLPPLSEQKRIVEWIDAVATRAEEAQRLRKEVSRETDHLWDGVSRRLLESLGTLESRPLGELVEIIGGGTPSKQNPLFWEGAIPWFSPKDMKARELFQAADTISEAGVQNSSAKVLPTSAVLIVIRGMILAHTVPVAVLRVPAAINQDMKALIPKNGILPEFLCHTLWALNRELLDLVDRSSHDTRKLTTPKLLTIRVPVPTVIAQQRFISEVESLLTKANQVRKASSASTDELEAVVPCALNEVFNGES